MLIHKMTTHHLCDWRTTFGRVTWLNTLESLCFNDQSFTCEKPTPREFCHRTRTLQQVIFGIPEKLGLHVNLVTRGNEAAAADAPFARLHCTQEKRFRHEWRLLLPGQCHPAGVQPLVLLQAFSNAAKIAIIAGSAADFDNW